MNERPETPPTSVPVPKAGSSVWLPLAFIGAAVIVSVMAVVFFRTGRPRVLERDLAEEARADLERRKFRPLSGPLQALLTDNAYKPIPTQTHPLLGQAAPDFTLADTDGKAWQMSEKSKAGPVVLVFYYGYHCDHCVSQLFGIHKDIEKFRELGVQVAAISADPPELTRERFAKYGAFAFPVLSDVGNKVAQQYGTFVPAKQPGGEGGLAHGTFIVSKDGRLLWSNRGDEPFTENRTLLVEIHRIERGRPVP